MDIKSILSKCDHTLLKTDAKEEDIKKICDEGLMFSTASVCIPPSYVKFASDYLNGRLKVCTVIGFPNGYQTTETKCFETENAVDNGADEIDMVINIGWLKDKRYDLLLNEINAIKKSCKGKLLKVIIETAKLNEDEIIRMCEIVSESDADYIKTSTGFDTRGANDDDIQTMALYMDKDKGIKAAGGISNFEDAQRFIELGATRLGTSRLVKIAIKENLLEE